MKWTRMRSNKAALKSLPAVTSALSLGLIGILGMWAGTPWLIPSLGPTIAIQTSSPDLPGARPWNVVAGHAIGLASGYAAVYATGANHVASVIEAHSLSAHRVAAAVLAVLLSMLVQSALKAQHPPAEATTLLVALGALHATAENALSVTAGVVLVALLGELGRRLMLASASGDRA